MRGCERGVHDGTSFRVPVTVMEERVAPHIRVYAECTSEIQEKIADEFFKSAEKRETFSTSFRAWRELFHIPAYRNANPDFKHFQEKIREYIPTAIRSNNIAAIQNIKYILGIPADVYKEIISDGLASVSDAEVVESMFSYITKGYKDDYLISSEGLLLCIKRHACPLLTSRL